MLTNKKAVIFDLDGTLVDSMWVWAQIDIDYLGAYGMEVPGMLQHDIEGKSFTETAVYFKERFQIPDSVEEIKKKWQDMAMDKYCHEVMLKDGVQEFLPWLKKREMKLAVASSNDYNLIEAVLKSHGVRGFFDEIITSCEVRKGKPAPDVYLEAASRLGTVPQECLVFEDIVPGIMAGKNAGMRVCAVEDAYSVFQNKEKREAADYFIQSYRQVIAGTYEET